MVVVVVVVCPAGCRLLHLLLCHSAAEPGGNYPGQESVWPAQLSLPSECSAPTNPREEMVGASASKENHTVPENASVQQDTLHFD